MNYEVYGGFELPRKDNRTAEYDKSFWTTIDDTRDGLSEACGCYVFALRNGYNFKPWYVGKAERLTFKVECFSPGKRLIFNDILIDHNGRGFLFLLPRLTESNKLCKATTSSYRDIEALENMLIGLALAENSLLANIKKTTLLRDLRVPGIINSPQAAPKLPVRDLRNALGLAS